jgi:hypothetical protein
MVKESNKGSCRLYTLNSFEFSQYHDSQVSAGRVKRATIRGVNTAPDFKIIAEPEITATATREKSCKS